jgi:hypothetical protein
VDNTFSLQREVVGASFTLKRKRANTALSLSTPLTNTTNRRRKV